MTGTPVKIAEVDVGDCRCVVRYYEVTTARGTRRYTAEIALAPGDHIIIDDDSIAALEGRVARLIPETLQSRQLARRDATGHEAA